MLTGLLLLLAVVAASPARAERLVTDLSDNMIDINARFSGTDLMVFGAIDMDIPQDDGGHGVVVEGMDYDMIVVVTSDPKDMMIRRKERISGIWVNKGMEELSGVPGYYALGTTRHLDDLLAPAVRKQYQIGLDNISLPLSQGLDAEEREGYRAGFIRNMKAKGLYKEEFGNINMREGILFWARMYFPANMPVGDYKTTVYLVRQGDIVLSRTTGLHVDKVGLERMIYNFAQQSPAAYGLVAILVALVAGWLGGFLSRKVS
ncbi:TIGR02186 family protein [Emcibacter nanhaiensis]|uniref:TIGR02186 family protein n=1 Tax=Emcibacter nanhaiensis TaxID=1505037 RepID=UPI001FE2FDA0|nr:TIGR02186 family protein [Emcibacter nanhaiensis]